MAIQRPEGTRTRKRGLRQFCGTLILKESSALPSLLKVTADVSMAASVAPAGLPALQTRVPTTLVTPPGEPVEFPPLRTRPSISKAPSPVWRLTRALPPRVVQGPGARVDLADRIVGSGGGDHAGHSAPVYNCIVLGECRGCEHQCQKRD